jgi:SAM-dependent methyltransferase
LSTERDWILWGKQDPYYGVLSADRFRGENIHLHRDEFFALGESEIRELVDVVARLYGATGRKVAVDFGSGVGRLTIPLARRYERVIGIDISPGMMAEAKKNCEQAGIANVDFRSSPEELAMFAEGVDLVVSRIVLQHIPPSVGLALIDKLLSHVRPGGVASLHVTTQRQLAPGKEFVYRIKHHVPFARYVLNVLQGKRWDEPLMQMNNYSLELLLGVYETRGMTEIFLQPTGGTSSGFIVHARKAKAG